MFLSIILGEKVINNFCTSNKSKSLYIKKKKIFTSKFDNVDAFMKTFSKWKAEHKQVYCVCLFFES